MIYVVNIVFSTLCICVVVYVILCFLVYSQKKATKIYIYKYTETKLIIEKITFTAFFIPHLICMFIAEFRTAAVFLFSAFLAFFYIFGTSTTNSIWLISHKQSIRLDI